MEQLGKTAKIFIKKYNHIFKTLSKKKKKRNKKWDLKPESVYIDYL